VTEFAVRDASAKIVTNSEVVHLASSLSIRHS